MSQKDLILGRLKDGWLAVHEFNLIGVSENSIASRLPELALAGKVVSRVRKGENWKEWHLAVDTSSQDSGISSKDSPVLIKEVVERMGKYPKP